MENKLSFGKIQPLKCPAACLEVVSALLQNQETPAAERMRLIEKAEELIKLLKNDLTQRRS